MKELRVVIADDSALIREGLQRELSRHVGIRLVGIATDGPHSYWLAQTIKPDVLILDLNMPKATGLEVLEEIRKHNNSMVVIIFSADPSTGLQKACLDAGANIFVNKSNFKDLVDICTHLTGQ